MMNYNNDDEYNDNYYNDGKSFFIFLNLFYKFLYKTYFILSIKEKKGILFCLYTGFSYREYICREYDI